jgi:CDP-glucose 4,6-dehydratase
MSILITGHTGFKGFTLGALLSSRGLKVHGFSDAFRPNSLYGRALKEDKIFESEFVGKIESFNEIDDCLALLQPKVIFHLAAQPIVSLASENPMTAFQTNTIGTGNLLESCRKRQLKTRIVIITTDKVYADHGNLPHKEEDHLSSKEPYGASKVGAELISESFRVIPNCENMQWATARAGNIVGFGDDGVNRLLPDLLTAKLDNKVPKLRSPGATRPWTYILDALMGYIELSNYLKSPLGAKSFNFGPSTTESVTVLEIARMVLGPNISSELGAENFFEQENLLLDSTMAKSILNWNPLFDSREAIMETIAVSSLHNSLESSVIQTLNFGFDRYFDKADNDKIKMVNQFDGLRV